MSYTATNKTNKTTFSKNSSETLLTFGEVIGLWHKCAAFRDIFISTLQDEPFEAFFWETPPMTLKTMNSPYEHVVRNAPNLKDIQPTPEVFCEHLNKAKNNGDIITTFSNLGGDTTLISPVFGNGGAHFASFLRNGESEQVHALLKAISLAVNKKLHDKPLWLSTSGEGVSWLHVRLDARPKYYKHIPYKNM